MRPAHAALFCLALSRWAFGQKPDVSVTKFDELPARLFYLEDTTAAFYHDIVGGTVYVSDNEGKSWKPAPGVPQGTAMLAIEHPFDHRRAYIVTKGTKHYMTDNKGQTWQSFEMPAPPAFVGNPFSFHSDPKKYDHVLYLGTVCEKDGILGWFGSCMDVTYYTTDNFGHNDVLFKDTSRCTFAHSSKEFKHEAPVDMVYCVAFATQANGGQGSGHGIRDSHLFQSQDWFKKERLILDFDVGEKNARGVVAFGISSKFGVAALKNPSGNGEMTLFVTTDTVNWAKAYFPHAGESRLRENGYTIVESTQHSLGVDVLLQNNANIGTFYVSNSNGTYFVESLRDTNRDQSGYVDFETIVGVEGVGLANVVTNAREVEAGREGKRLASRITFDDGSSWSPVKAPSNDADGKNIGCDTSDHDKCGLHLHSITAPHNFGRVFSTAAPGFVMGVGSVGPSLRAYEDCDTFLSTNAGVSWTMISAGAHKYEFGNKGAILAMIDDEKPTEILKYSFDSGKSWKELKLPVKFRVKAFTSVPDATSQQFLIVGALDRKDFEGTKRYATIHVDFAPMRSRECKESDMETFSARTIKGKECLMGHKQSYTRKKPDADCYMGKKFEEPTDHQEKCDCTDDDYECDYNYVRNEDKCEPMGPEPIPAGVCSSDRQHTYMGSSGWRLIPGNTCKAGSTRKDAKVEKQCSAAQKPEGEISHQTFPFPARIAQHAFFRNSQTVLVRLQDGSVFYSLNEGFSWAQREGHYLAFYMHPYANERAYLITATRELYHTTNHGRDWLKFSTPAEPNTQRVPVLSFHPTRDDWLIWTGAINCPGPNCHAKAFYTTDHGRNWVDVESYVRTCAWARDKDLRVDEQLILCESYRDKKGAQETFGYENPLQFISGGHYYTQKNKIFDSVVGYAKFSEYLLVAELPLKTNGLTLQVSLDGKHFASGLFPPNMRLENHAYTILESTTDSVFLHLTMSTQPHAEYGSIMKSNSNGTYYSVSQDFVNRNAQGFVDFEKLIGLDGIALVNVVANPDKAAVEKSKKIQTLITHNDGGSWRKLTPPAQDSHGQPYKCKDVKCTLQLHGFTERYDVRATYSSPSVVGLMMAVGNVGEYLAEYRDSDTFLSRDGGFTWEEIRKDAHLWEFGDSGSVLVMANDEEPTDHVVYSLDEGISWHVYKFENDDKMRVRWITTVSTDTSRKFVLFGHHTNNPNRDIAVHVDFSQLTKTKCVMNPTDPNKDDFELWSPSEEREERCLFGRQVQYHRRIRNRNCFVGSTLNKPVVAVSNCTCTRVDFECEFNHIRDASGDCVLSPGATPLPNDPTCVGNQEFWYERTAYRRIPHSTCQGGNRIDHGKQHSCPGPQSHSSIFWVFFSLVIVGMVVFAAWYFHERSLHGPGAIRLGENGPFDFAGPASGPMSMVASVPWFVVGVASSAWSWVDRQQLPTFLRPKRPYRHIPVDEDARVLRFEDDE